MTSFLSPLDLYYVVLRVLGDLPDALAFFSLVLLTTFGGIFFLFLVSRAVGVFVTLITQSLASYKGPIRDCAIGSAYDLARHACAVLLASVIFFATPRLILGVTA